MTERGAIYSMAAKGTYTGKPRPAIVLQSDKIALDSLIVVPLTSTPVDAALIRVPIAPAAGTGLQQLSYAMTDKLTTVPKANLGKQIGKVGADGMRRIEQAVRSVVSGRPFG